MGDDEDPETFDLGLSDVTTHEMSVFMAGLGSVGATAVARGDAGVLEAASILTQKALKENPELARATLLEETDDRSVKIAGDLPEDVLDEIGVELLDDGTVVDRLDEDDAVDIEVE